MIFPARFVLRLSSEHADPPISLKHYPKTFQEILRVQVKPTLCILRPTNTSFNFPYRLVPYDAPLVKFPRIKSSEGPQICLNKPST